MTTRLNYDDLGREISRQIETASGEVLTISQSWQLAGQRLTGVTADEAKPAIITVGAVW
ncbi:hypothetical protein [Arsenophonus endosymbiont of Aleurodicus floccissimus]|uniref:hypothetical protein n=1 Tax=Arsenophonus endosymbiont of Aleurodicus floccissimus TaxID=2152761 RepID=UPI0015FED2B3|nr:hypothetical protein [Arsenophonus endosymbiont of Aleurodicus floccissimus]